MKSSPGLVFSAAPLDVAGKKMGANTTWGQLKAGDDSTHSCT